MVYGNGEIRGIILSLRLPPVISYLRTPCRVSKSRGVNFRLSILLDIARYRPPRNLTGVAAPVTYFAALPVVLPPYDQSHFDFPIPDFAACGNALRIVRREQLGEAFPVILRIVAIRLTSLIPGAA